MINTYRYGGQGEVEKDGKKSTVQIPPPVVLNQMGAFIKVTILQNMSQESTQQALIWYPCKSGQN